jgi:predicted dinucleotide-binding enzyme
MNIAIIGAGNIGATLTRRLTALGYHVRVANSRGPETLAALAQETGAHPAALAAVTHGADLVIVALPYKAIETFNGDLLGALPPSVPVVDVSNYVPGLRDPHIDELDNGAIESRWVESHLGHPVIKAFNSITAAHLLSLGRPAGNPDRIAVPVAGDDLTAKARVLTLIDDLGFDAIDARSLDDSWRQQPGTPVHTTDLIADNARTALAQARSEHTVQWRARMAAAPIGG